VLRLRPPQAQNLINQSIKTEVEDKIDDDECKSTSDGFNFWLAKVKGNSTFEHADNSDQLLSYCDNKTRVISMLTADFNLHILFRIE
jgi:hypothetical protein